MSVKIVLDLDTDHKNRAGFCSSRASGDRTVPLGRYNGEMDDDLV